MRFSRAAQVCEYYPSEAIAVASEHAHEAVVVPQREKGGRKNNPKKGKGKKGKGKNGKKKTKPGPKKKSVKHSVAQDAKGLTAEAKAEGALPLDTPTKGKKRKTNDTRVKTTPPKSSADANRRLSPKQPLSVPNVDLLMKNVYCFSGGTEEIPDENFVKLGKFTELGVPMAE